MVAAAIASRVLPLPPSPVSVSSRQSGFTSRPVTSASSLARPTKGMGYTEEECLIMALYSVPVTHSCPYYKRAPVFFWVHDLLFSLLIFLIPFSDKKPRYMVD